MNGHRPFSPGGGNGSKCPEADTHHHPHDDEVGRQGTFPICSPCEAHALETGHSLPEVGTPKTALVLAIPRAPRRAEISSFTGS